MEDIQDDNDKIKKFFERMSLEVEKSENSSDKESLNRLIHSNPHLFQRIMKNVIEIKTNIQNLKVIPQFTLLMKSPTQVFLWSLFHIRFLKMRLKPVKT